LGKYTTHDEAGCAAYKTLELDLYFGGEPSLYREVEDFESEKFLSLFPKLIIQRGGVESTFSPVGRRRYRRPRLYHIKGVIKEIVAVEVPIMHDSLNNVDVFVLDDGERLFLFRGKDVKDSEKYKGDEVLNCIDEENGHQNEIIVLDENQEANATGKEFENWKCFWNFLGGKYTIKERNEEPTSEFKPNQIFKISLTSETITYTELPFKISSLQEDDVYIISTYLIVYTWIGKSSKVDKKSAFSITQQFLNEYSNCPSKPIVITLSSTFITNNILLSELTNQ
jgi:gelsolin